ncbi:unnamed protein product, partial [Mesorhabditis spiculigera]
MGKGRNKNKDGDGGFAPNHANKRKDKNEDYDSDSGESMSTHITFDEDLQSVRGDIDGDEDTLIDSLSEHIDNASHKNVGIRTAALKHLLFGLTSRYLSDEVAEDISDSLGQLRFIVTDPAKNDAIRAHCALCLALATYFGTDSDELTALALKALRQTWTATKSTAVSWRLFDISLASWALLLQDGPTDALTSAIQDQPKIVGYLEANCTEIRIAAGEVLAFLYEYVDDAKPGFRFPNHNHVQEILETLLADSSKSKAKRDKRIQKFSLRQVQVFIDGGEFPSLKVKFSTQESLELDSCAKKLLYDLCTDLLRGGMMQQLKENGLLRDYFSLGAPVQASGFEDKISKAERLGVHGAAAKYRHQVRSKQRDKRTAY